jgi:ATP-dependent DNA ligase
MDGLGLAVSRVSTWVMSELAHTEAMLRDLLDKLRDMSRPDSPFDTLVPRDRARQTQWVNPELVGEVEYRTFSPATMHHARPPRTRTR